MGPAGSVGGLLGLALVFVWGGALQGGFGCYFSGVFCWYRGVLQFCWGAGCWAIGQWGLSIFLISSNS